MWEYHDPYHPSADELYHFKYVKRVRGPNGKWQYYYDRDAVRSDAKSAASYAKAAYRNARNNAIRKGVDARRTISNKASALSYRLKNRGLAGRQADRDATESMLDANRRSRLTSQNKRKAASWAGRNKGLAGRQAARDAMDGSVAFNRGFMATGRSRRINSGVRGELARQKRARAEKRMTPAQRKQRLIDAAIRPKNRSANPNKKKLGR